MRILFLHQNFPAQFRDLAHLLGQQKNMEVKFITNREQGSLEGVEKRVYPKPRGTHRELHPYLRSFEQGILHGQATFREAMKLRKEGWVPDLIYGHNGFGPTMFMPDIFPGVPLLVLFEWYYQPRGSDIGFDPADPVTPDALAKLRVRNAPILMDLVTCAGGNSPTRWQASQFPRDFHKKLTVLHEGIDTQFYTAKRDQKLVLPRIGLDLSQAQEIVTYVARGMEPYRGFPQFMKLVERLQAERPGLHAVIVGEDRCAYGSPRADGRTFKEVALAELKLDPKRTHFTGLLPYPEYLQVLRASSVHVYLTYPFVLSWSFMEAMACECNIVASDTAPVKEMMRDGIEGLLTPFFDADKLLARTIEALEAKDAPATRERGANARKLIVERYALRDLLPKRVQWMSQFLPKRTTPRK